jgi:hypothetical protein
MKYSPKLPYYIYLALRQSVDANLVIGSPKDSQSWIFFLLGKIARVMLIFWDSSPQNQKLFVIGKISST